MLDVLQPLQQIQDVGDNVNGKLKWALKQAAKLPGLPVLLQIDRQILPTSYHICETCDTE